MKVIQVGIGGMGNAWINAVLQSKEVSFAGFVEVNDTIIEEHIYKDAGAKRDVMTVPQLMQFIRTAGYTPVERDTVYNELEVFA